MTPRIALLTACMATCTVANAALYDVKFTATVSSITANAYFSDATLQSSGNLAGFTINIGDPVTGNFTFETGTPISSWEDETRKVAYYNFFPQSIAIGQEGFVETGVWGGGSVVDSKNSAVSADSINFSTRVYNLSPGYIGDTNFSFQDPSATVLSDTGLSLDKLHDFGDPTFSYSYFVIGNGWLVFDSNVTSWSVTPAVPEPSTYAMLAAGLGLLAFRRKRI